MCASVVLGFVFPYQAVFSNQHSCALNVGYSIWHKTQRHTQPHIWATVFGPGEFVLDGDPTPLPKKGTEPPNFRPMFIVAKRLSGSRWYLAWRLASAQATLCQMETQHPSPIFGPFVLWPNGWMNQDATWYGGRPQPRGLCVRWGPSPPPKFSAYVYYTYCNFIRTLNNEQSLLVCSSSSSSSSTLCILFLEKFSCTQSVPI